MYLRDRIKRIWFAITANKRLVLLDYQVNPVPLLPHMPDTKLYELFNHNREEFSKILGLANQFVPSLLSITKEQAPKTNTAPVWNNQHLPALDIIMLYTILATAKPKKYLEIGSGTSTQVAYKAKKEQNLSFTIHCIDPAPRKNIDSLTDRIDKKDLQKIPLRFFKELEAGDILFFDGTHVLAPNSDVLWFFIEILPILKKGVLVQLHDIYLPYDYPAFMCNRFYNEQYVLANSLLSNPQKYRIICPCYFISTEKKLHQQLQSFWEAAELSGVETHGGSCWIEIMQ